MGRTKPLVILILVIPMLSIGKLGNGQDAYYLKLAAEDYYIGGGEPQGVWLPTTGARVLGLSDSVSKDGFHALFHGHAPDGTPLVQNAGKADRRPGYDLTFSAPKTVSVLWAMASPDIRHAIQECQRQAVTEAIQHVEREATFSRRGKGGSGMTRAGVVVAAFEHGTSRALDCQLHTHALVLNVATRDDGTTGSLESKPLYDHKMVTGAVYRAQLAHLLQERLGLQIVRQGTSFEIAGVPSKLCDHFSQRRQEIEKKLGQKGLDTAAAAAVAALDTRQTKGIVPPRSELFDQWQQIGARFCFTGNRVSDLLYRTSPQDDRTHAADIVGRSVQALLDRSTSFDTQTLLKDALYAAVEQGVHPEAIRKAVDHHLTNAPDVLRISRPDERPRYTTTHAQQLQRRTSQSIDKLNSSRVSPPSRRMVDAAIAHFSKPRDPTLEELKYHVSQIVRAASKRKTWRIDRACIARRTQRTVSEKHAASIRDIARGRSRIATLAELSPDDRYLVLACCREAWQKAGYNVLGVSRSNVGAKRLYQETGIDAMSHKRLELMMHPTAKFQLKYHARQLWRAARLKPTFALEPLKITKDTVLVVDDAESLSSQQMATLTRDVARQGGKLVLVRGSAGQRHGPSHTAFDSICRQLRQPQPHERPRQRPTRDQAIDELINRQTPPQGPSRRYV